MKNTLKYLVKEKNYGKVYYYVRLDRKGARTRVKGEYGSPEFVKNYLDALKAQNENKIESTKKIDGKSLTWLIKEYCKSSRWTNDISESTRRNRLRYLSKMIDTFGSDPYESFTFSDLEATKEHLKSVPNSANDFVKAARGLFTWAYQSGFIASNPSERLNKFKTRSFGHKKWTDEEVEKYRSSYPWGSRERIAFELLINTGLRRSDVCKIGREHLKDGIISIRCMKNKELVHIPISQELEAALKAIDPSQPTFISKTNGQPLTIESFGNFFGESCRKIGIEKTAHGLRKYLATNIAESGGTERELRATFGWKSSYEAETYVREADKKRLTKEALSKLKGVKFAPRM